LNIITGENNIQSSSLLQDNDDAHLTAISRTTWVRWYQNVSILGDMDDKGGGDNWSYKNAIFTSNKPTSGFLQGR